MLLPDRLRQITSLLFPGIIVIHSLAFIFYWVTNRLFIPNVNDFLFDKTGMQLGYVLIFQVFSLLVALLSLSWLHWQLPVLRSTGWFIGSFFLIFFYGSFILLFREDPTQVSRLRQLIVYFRLILDALLLGVVVWILSRGWLTGKFPLSFWIALLVIVWGIAFLFPPGNVYRGALSSRPLLIAHRGASMLAPENTLASAKLAANLGVFGLETDVRISQDGILFMMHDNTLLRTTDVAEIFPGKEKENASNFSYDQLRQLNAGAWFAKQDPYGTLAAGLVAQDEINRYRSERVPTLEAELQVVQENGLVFICDLLAPPADHPFSVSFFRNSLETLKNAGLDGQIWFLANDQERILVQAQAPELKLAAGISAANPPEAKVLALRGYQIVNSEYSLPVRYIRLYQQAGLWVNLYTVDEPWQYSRLWLLGVPSVTTNNVHNFLSMGHPFFALPAWAYTLIWAGVGMFGLLMFWMLRRGN